MKQNNQQCDESGNDGGHAETGRDALFNAFRVSCSIVLSGICQECSGKCDSAHLHHAIILIGGGISGNKGRPLTIGQILDKQTACGNDTELERHRERIPQNGCQDRAVGYHIVLRKA